MRETCVKVRYDNRGNGSNVKRGVTTGKKSVVP